MRKELEELRQSDARTLRNMRDMFMEYYTAKEAHRMLAKLYAGWYLEQPDLTGAAEQAAMYRFYKWLSILVEADHLLGKTI